MVGNYSSTLLDQTQNAALVGLAVKSGQLDKMEFGTISVGCQYNRVID